MRYTQLVRIAEQLKPNTILEVGTHRGTRAKELVRHCEFYIGFDLWEDGDSDNDLKERNGNGRSSMQEAIRAIGKKPHLLVKGNTRKTLPEFNGYEVDLAFIDGGHSVKTIESDWKEVKRLMKPGGIVVFDDYYEPEIDGFGCNQVVKDIEHEILPDVDTFSGIGIRLVKIVC